MQVLLIGPLPPPVGGATLLFKQLARELSGRHDVSVLVVNTSRASAGGGDALRRALRVAVELVGSIRRCDVVSFHSSRRGAALFGPVVAIVCKVYRKPWIFRGFGDFAGWHRSSGRLIRTSFEQTALRADVVLFETKDSVKYFESRTASHVGWYANSRPPSEAPIARETPPRHSSRFVFVGHVKPSKGVRELIMAGQQLAGKVHVDVFGELSEGLHERDFNGAHVQYRGSVAPEDVSRTIRAYDALVLPTYYDGEGYPGVILEAYAEGIPVITTRWRSIPEIVDDGRSGLLIPPKDVTALADAMDRIAAQPEFAASLRSGAALMAIAFSSPFWTQRFVDIAQSVVAVRWPGNKAK